MQNQLKMLIRECNIKYSSRWEGREYNILFWNHHFILIKTKHIKEFFIYKYELKIVNHIPANVIERFKGILKIYNIKTN